jgi:rubrerythrin
MPEGVHVDDRRRKPPKVARRRHKRETVDDYEASLQAEEALRRAKAREAQQLYEDLLKARTVDTSVAWSCPMCGHVNDADHRRCTQCRHEF